MPAHNKYTPERGARILDGIRAGNTREVCARRGGICVETLRLWVKAGKAAKSGQMWQFAQDFDRAEADAEAMNVACVQTAARPREVVTVTNRQTVVQRKVKTRYPDGRIVEESVPEVLTLETTTRTKDFDWRAAAWWLERRHHFHWRQRQDVDLAHLSEDQLVALLEASVEAGGDPAGDRPLGADGAAVAAPQAGGD